MTVHCDHGPDVRHLPMVYDFCGTPLYHGERDDCSACFCGAPYYLHCEGWLNGGGISEFVIERAPLQPFAATESESGKD